MKACEAVLKWYFVEARVGGWPEGTNTGITVDESSPLVTYRIGKLLNYCRALGKASAVNLGSRAHDETKQIEEKKKNRRNHMELLIIATQSL